MNTKWLDYRAWHIEKKAMMHVSAIDCREHHDEVVLSPWTTYKKEEIISSRFDEVVLMPWTTYYDDSRNSVKIYEGDIIEVTHKDMTKRFVIDDEMGILLARCIADDPYPFVMFDLDMLIDDAGRIKVIGNAYENPELLEMKEV